MIMRQRVVPSAAVVALLLASGAAQAQEYPVKPIRIIVPSSPGGGTDILARQLSVKLTERWGQQVIVDNRPGAGQMIGISLVAKSPPDGYTLVMTATPLAINTVLYKKVPYDPIRDFAPVTQVAAMPNLLVMHPTLPVRNVKQMIALAKSRPGELAYASSGFGTGPHLSMELFNHMTGIKLQHVPYKGTGPGLIEHDVRSRTIADVDAAAAFAASEDRPVARAGRHQRKASLQPTRCSHCGGRRHRRLRGGRLVRDRRARGHAAAGRREAADRNFGNPPCARDARQARGRRRRSRGLETRGIRRVPQV